MSVWAWVSCLILVFLPGLWVSGALPLAGFGLRMRLLVALALTPWVVFVQFVLVRACGASFEQAAWILPFANLPALLFVRGKLRWPRRVPRRLLAATALVAALVVAYLWIPVWVNPHGSQVHAHAWMHTDTVYALAGGARVPEETVMAGVRGAYPWAGHVLPALLTYLADTSPMASYVPLNVLWTLVLCGLCGALAAEMGGGALARAGAAIAFLLGLNVLGFATSRLLGPDSGMLPFCGDWRYTPPLWKFRFFNQVAFALCPLAGAMYVSLRSWRDPTARRVEPWLLFFCACSVGFVYPVMYPAMAMIVGAGMATLLVAQRADPSAGHRARVLRVGLAFFIASLVVLAWARFATADRAESLLRMSGGTRMVMKAVGTLFAVALFLPCVAIVLRTERGPSRVQSAHLLLGATGCAALYVLLDVPWWRMEYKFMFAVALCLAPFAGLAAEFLAQRLGPWKVPVGLATLGVLALPLTSKVLASGRGGGRAPQLDVSSFFVQLGAEERSAPTFAAIRERTPPDTVVLLDASILHGPTLFRRSLFAPPEAEHALAGFNMAYDKYLSLVRGYDPELIAERGRVRAALFAAETSDRDRAAALARVLELGRPVALVLEASEHAALHAWLTRELAGGPLYSGEGLELWLIPAP